MLDEMIDAALVLLRKLIFFFLLFSTKETLAKLGSRVLGTNKRPNILYFNINRP